MLLVISFHVQPYLFTNRAYLLDLFLDPPTTPFISLFTTGTTWAFSLLEVGAVFSRGADTSGSPLGSVVISAKPSMAPPTALGFDLRPLFFFATGSPLPTAPLVFSSGKPRSRTVASA